MRTATLKPVQSTGKQKTSARTASGAAGNTPTDPSNTFEEAVDAARERFLENVEKETFQREVSTSEAIDAAQPAHKLSALQSGINDWEKALCIEAVRHYDTSIKRFAGSPIRGERPVDSAYRETVTGLSLFLRVSALDGHEEGRTGRVREFIFRAVTPADHPRALELASRDATEWFDSPLEFQLPPWAARRSPSFGELIGAPRIKPLPHVLLPLSVHQTDRVVGTEERRLLNGLQEALRIARRDARIEADIGPSSSSKAEPLKKDGMKGQPADGKLPPMTVDVSMYTSRADLTDKQVQCFTLHRGYGMRKTDIARRLGITRQSVDEHIARADRKISLALSNEGGKHKAAKRIADSNDDEEE